MHRHPYTHTWNTKTKRTKHRGARALEGLEELRPLRGLHHGDERAAVQQLGLLRGGGADLGHERRLPDARRVHDLRARAVVLSRVVWCWGAWWV